MKVILICCFICISTLIGFFAGRLTADMNSQVVRIDKPLYISTKEEYGICKIPPGTKLYYVRSMAEGGDVYKIYLYYEGKPLKTKRPKYRWDMEFISARFE